MAENLEVVKDIFFFIGSVMGIIAFARSAINPMMDENRDRWNKVLNIFDDEFFQSLEYLDQIRAVENEQLSKLWFFIDEVREKKDYLEFKFPNKKIFDKHLRELVRLVQEFDEEITPPIWSKDYPNTNRDRYTLNKRYFHQTYDDHREATKEYMKHLNYAANLSVKMRMEFQALQAIANLHFIELPFKRRVIKKAKSKYSDRIINK